jgi:hypothetical protein
MEKVYLMVVLTVKRYRQNSFCLRLGMRGRKENVFLTHFNEKNIPQIAKNYAIG